MLAHALVIAALAVPIQTQHDSSLTLGTTDTGGTKITAASINSAKYTGWIYVGDVKQLVLAVDYGNDSGTAVTMTCNSALVNTGADGTGYAIHSVASDGTSTVFTWSNAVSGDEDWTWTVYNVPLPWINCAITATSGGVDDVATVIVLGVSP